MSRATRLGAVGLTGLVTVLLTASPAWADYPIGNSEGDDPGKGLGAAGVIGLFVLVPLAAVILIGTLAYLPGARRTFRYRPAKGWIGAPIWFAGPPEPAAAVQSAELGDVLRGGASGSW